MPAWQQADFRLYGYPPSSGGQPFAILLSESPGNLVLDPFAIRIDLEIDAVLVLGLSVPGLFGVLDAAGEGRSTGLTVPIEMRGRRFFVAGVGLDSRGAAYPTDAIAVRVR